MRNTASAWAAGLLLLLFAGCTPEPRGESAAAVDTPSTAGPARIVSILPNVSELVHALGEGDRLVARSAHCDYPPEVEELPLIGSGMAPDVEQILALRPDVVIGGAWQDRPEITEALRRRGVEVVLLPEARLADLPVALEMLGALLGVPERAAAIAEQVEAGLAAAAARVEAASGGEPLQTLHVIGRDPVVVAGPDTFVGELHLRLGLRLLPERGAWVHLDAEALHLLRPDLLVEAGSVEGMRERWGREGGPALCAIDANVAVRPGPRLTEAAAQLAGCVEALGATSP